MNINFDNLILHIQELANMAATDQAYVSKPLLSYILHRLDLTDYEKKVEIHILESALKDGLDIDFTGTQWEAEWLANNKVCKCNACNEARKCIAEIEKIGI